MTDRPLPGWPRGLSAPMAAAYVGLSVTTWRREVAAGRAPAAIPLTAGRLVWLREELDRWLDSHAGRSSAPAGENPWLDRLDGAA